MGSREISSDELGFYELPVSAVLGHLSLRPQSVSFYIIAAFSLPSPSPLPASHPSSCPPFDATSVAPIFPHFSASITLLLLSPSLLHVALLSVSVSRPSLLLLLPIPLSLFPFLGIFLQELARPHFPPSQLFQVMEAMAPDEMDQDYRQKSGREELEDKAQDQIRAKGQEVRDLREEIRAKEEEIRGLRE
ncbi:uncharacterized protein [Physcomitrium patens]|uniref:uncharacterized protein n=1 Tax=Physcomitrium patens TaxID=3218 RepID=UPI003CCD1115